MCIKLSERDAQGDSPRVYATSRETIFARMAFGIQDSRKMPGKVEKMSLEIADHTLFVSWSRLPQQQHGAQQPVMGTPDAVAVALLKKRQKLAMQQSKVRMR